jgi:hypothetical protein
MGPYGLLRRDRQETLDLVRVPRLHLARGGTGRLDELGDVPRDEAQLDGQRQGL